MVLLLTWLNIKLLATWASKVLDLIKFFIFQVCTWNLRVVTEDFTLNFKLFYLVFLRGVLGPLHLPFFADESKTVPL